MGLLSAWSAFAQTSPFLPEDLYRKLVNEVSGEIAHEHIRWFTHYHRPMGGSEGFEAVARYVEKKARDYGLEDVRTIRLNSDTETWNAHHGELWMVEPERRRLAFTPELAISMADYSRSGVGENIGVVDVGEGIAESDYRGKDIAGKIVLATGTLATVMEEAVWKRGALGILYFTMNRPDLADQIPWVRVPVQNKAKTKNGTFAFVVSQREGLRLRKHLSTAPLRVSYRIESAYAEKSSQAIVEAVIRGSEIHDQDIVLTGHLQEGPFSANDDASGCASVLEIGRALKSMIDRGEIPRPRRDIRFWWADEISAEEEYFAEHPGERQQMLANMNQDMVGAKQSAGHRIQFVTRTPDSRAHFLGDLAASIVNSLVEGNTSYLAAGQARQLTRGETGTSAVTSEELPFSRPILSRLGTREPYDARVIPFHNNTDHQVFNMGIIGIPGITFTNWPDEYIHSSDDDLWQIDRTQLKRNAIAVGAITLFLANASDRDVPRLANEVYSNSVQRIQRDIGTATRMLQERRDYQRAAGLVRAAADRERQTLRSVATIARAQNSPIVAALESKLPTPDAAVEQLNSYTRLLGIPPPAPPAPSQKELQMSRKIPRVTTSVRTYVSGRGKIERPKSLHALMGYEALNFVDGRRSYLDIYRLVAAEADAAGSWYYGEVTLDDVAAHLDSAAKNGLLTLTSP